MAMNNNTNSAPPTSSVHPVSRTLRTQPSNSRTQPSNPPTQPLNPRRQPSGPTTQPSNPQRQSSDLSTQPSNPRMQSSGPPKPLANPDPSKSSNPRHSLSWEEVQEALKYHAEELFRLMFGSPENTKAPTWYSRGKLSVNMSMQGEKRGLWYNSDSAEGGNLFDLVARKFLNLKSAKDDFSKVLQESARYCGITAGQPVDMHAIKAHAVAREQKRQKAEQHDNPEPSKPRYSFPTEVVQEALNDRAEALFRHAFGEPVRTNTAEWRSREKSSRGMHMQGAKRGLWYDFVSAEGGNLFDLVARLFLSLHSASDDFPRVIREAARYCGIIEDQPVDMRALKERAAKREKEAKEEEEREIRQRMALVKALLEKATPIAGQAGRQTPGQAYLASRGITEVPKNGLSNLPPLPGIAVAGTKFPALVVWARNSAGEITGGQRILVNPDGSRANNDPRKPSFGFVQGSVAKFPARTSRINKNAPLVVAEGPESALSIWYSTGYETWSVFGSSGWVTAPIPLGRPVILAPDRDAPGSQADNAFAKAVMHHLVRGIEPRIAIAPEPVGSKNDLNDTLMRQNGGPAAVRASIERAIDVPEHMKEEARQMKDKARQLMKQQQARQQESQDTRQEASQDTRQDANQDARQQTRPQVNQQANQRVSQQINQQIKRQTRREVNTPRHRTAERGNEDSPSSGHHYEARDGPGF